MPGPAEQRLGSAAGSRSWAALAPGTRRRWIAQAGGPRSLAPAERARRAQLYYLSGGHLSREHTGQVARQPMSFRVVTTEGLREVTVTSYRDKSRLGARAHDEGALLGRLAYGEMSDAEFARRWRRRKREVGGYTLETDPARVRATWAPESDRPSFDAVRGGSP